MPDDTPRTKFTPGIGTIDRIEMRVRHVDDLFQAFDPAPMRERRIAPEADTYVRDQAEELKGNNPIMLSICLPESESSCCHAVQDAFRTHFARAANEHKSLLRDHFRIAWQTFFVAVVIAVALVYLSQSIADIAETALMNKIANGLSIAVWVVLWRPFEMLIHDWRPIDREYRLYRRLAGIGVESVAGAIPSLQDEGRKA